MNARLSPSKDRTSGTIRPTWGAGQMLPFSVAKLEWPLFSEHLLVNVELIVAAVDRIHLPGEKGCKMEGMMN